MSTTYMSILSIGLISSTIIGCHKPSETTIYVETSLGDFIDKITILKIKQERIDDPIKLENINNELAWLTTTYLTYVKPSRVLDELTEQLLHVNKNLWDLEDAIRLKERHKCFDHEFVTIVDSILNNNDQRACIKRSINLIHGSRIVEEKSYKHIKALDIKESDNCDQINQPVSLAVATPLGDLVDRITILMIKKICISDSIKLINICAELDTLEAILSTIIEPTKEFELLKEDLLKANQTMWDIQDAIRSKKQSGEFDNEFMQLGRQVYYTNDKRCAIKRSINDLFGSQLIEEKCYARY